MAVDIPLEILDDNPYQQRSSYSANAIDALAISIQEHGQLEPAIARAVGDRFQLIAGHMRKRALAKLAKYEFAVDPKSGEASTKPREDPTPRPLPALKTATRTISDDKRTGPGAERSPEQPGYRLSVGPAIGEVALRPSVLPGLRQDQLPRSPPAYPHRVG